MEFQKIVEFLDQYPTWFKVALVITIALAALGFLTLRQPKATGANLQPLVVPSQPPIPNGATEGVPATLDDYFRIRTSLDGRFLELEEFDKRLVAQPVSWNGYVASVSGQSVTPGFPILVIIATDRAQMPKLASVLLPEALRTKAYSLRKGDHVSFSGAVFSATSSPSVKAEKLELLSSAGGT